MVDVFQGSKASTAVGWRPQRRVDNLTQKNGGVTWVLNPYLIRAFDKIFWSLICMFQTVFHALLTHGHNIVAARNFLTSVFWYDLLP